jgi:hypothetical protein
VAGVADFSQKTRLLIIRRDGGRCQWCGYLLFASLDPISQPRRQYSLQHRRPRGMGGSKDPALGLPSNGVLVCGTGTTLCHGHIESNRDEAKRRGFLISGMGSPATFSLINFHAWEFWLDDAGNAVPVGAPE